MPAFATKAHRYVQRTAAEFKFSNKAFFVTSFPRHPFFPAVAGTGISTP